MCERESKHVLDMGPPLKIGWPIYLFLNSTLMTTIKIHV